MLHTSSVPVPVFPVVVILGGHLAYCTEIIFYVKLLDSAASGTPRFDGDTENEDSAFSFGPKVGDISGPAQFPILDYRFLGLTTEACWPEPQIQFRRVEVTSTYQLFDFFRNAKCHVQISTMFRILYQDKQLTFGLSERIPPFSEVNQVSNKGESGLWASRL